MQMSSAASVHSIFSVSSVELAANLGDDFRVKLNLTQETSDERKTEEVLLEEVEEEEEEVEEELEEVEEDEEEEEFSFACTNTDGSPISADDIFKDGQIRPIFPLFNQDLLFDDGKLTGEAETETSAGLRPPLKKLFVEERDRAASSSSEMEEPEGPFCVWRGKAVEASPEVCKKSNSTGFSKLWRFRELVIRSNSDGKDAFVFLNPSNPNHRNPTSATSTEHREKRSEKVVVVGKKVMAKKGKRVQTASLAHERHYVKNRAMKEGERRKSYLPYRQDLVGFFTNVNGLSRNIHPF